MRITRRTLLLGAGTGAVAVLLASCTGEPEPAPTTTKPSPRPTFDAGDVPEPAGWMRSGWSADPYFRGSMSFLPAGASPEHRTAIAESIDDRVIFAGEATDETRPGTVMGAIDSGRRAADVVVGAAWKPERIAVVGAGAAGAVAARTLTDAGHTVTVFEASDRIGGRILSVVDDEEWPLPVQLGAWLTVAGDSDADALRGELLALGIEELAFDTATGWSEDGAVATIDPKPVQDAVGNAADAPADLPIAEALTAAGVDPGDPATSAALAWLQATTGADVSRASSWFPPAFAPDALIGARGDIGALVEKAAKDLDISLSSPVVRIAHDDRGVSLRLGTGESLSFDRVIVTVPLGVLQQQGIEFSPALPFSHRGAIAALGSGAVETVWMRFDEPFWDADQAIWHVVGGDGLIRTWLNLEPATGEPILVGLVGGAVAEEYAALGDADALSAARASLAFFAPAE